MKHVWKFSDFPNLQLSFPKDFSGPRKLEIKRQDVRLDKEWELVP